MVKVVLIDHEPLTPNIEKRFCIKEIIAAGFSFEYWDVSQILYPGLSVADELNRDYSKVLTSFDEFKSLWTSLPDDCIAIPEFYFIPKSGKMWKLMRSRKIPLVKIGRYINYGDTRTFAQKFRAYFATPVTTFRYIRAVMFRVYMKLCGVELSKRYDYYLVPESLPGMSGNHVRRINHPDYDNYLIHKNDEPCIKGKYICFVETGFGLHPDEHYFEDKFYEDNNLWQKKLCGFFDAVEKKYGMPVVIAVHPKIEYPEDAFGGRKKIKYQTLNLVLNSEFVIQDASNSLSFSVIANKKIGFAVTEEFWRRYKQIMNQISDLVGLPVFNIDKQKFDDFEPAQLKEDNRKSYMYSLLCSEETKDKLSSDLIIEFFSKILQQKEQRSAE